MKAAAATGTPIEVQPHQKGVLKWRETYEVYPDEKALLLVERNEQAPDNSGFRRYQSIFVCRNDMLAKYMEDMGPAGLFVASGLSIPGGDPASPMGEWWETVASLKDYANDFRQWLALKGIQREIPDLVTGYHDDIDIEARTRRHMSQFGPLLSVTRS